MPVVWDAIKTQAAKLPLTKREAIARASIDPKTGKPFIMKFPADMQREYDQAYNNVLMTRKKEGFHIPKRQGGEINSRDSCMDTETFGTILGFAYGLQYDTKVPGECYNNLESTILALDTIVKLWWLILLPEKTPKVILAVQDLTTVLSNLYGNCQIQVFFETFQAMLSYEGLTSLLLRTWGGLQAELPFYTTKSQYAKNACVRGESMGKIVQLIFNYSI